MVSKHIRRLDPAGKVVDVNAHAGIGIRAFAQNGFPYGSSIEVPEQLAALRELEQEFPIDGLKIVPIACQTKVTKPLEEGEVFLEFAGERNWPVLFHVTADITEGFSGAKETFQVMEKHPELRYCLAHCISLHRGYLERADAMPNVWVDTSALKIQVQLAHENSPLMALPPDRLECDCSDHLKVMQSLVEHFPQTIVWGSDAPYHSYITRRLQAEGQYYDFRLKGTFEQEKAAWDVLSPDQRRQLASNTLQFVFG